MDDLSTRTHGVEDRVSRALPSQLSTCPLAGPAKVGANPSAKACTHSPRIGTLPSHCSLPPLPSTASHPQPLAGSGGGGCFPDPNAPRNKQPLGADGFSGSQSGRILSAPYGPIFGKSGSLHLAPDVCHHTEESTTSTAGTSRGLRSTGPTHSTPLTTNGRGPSTAARSLWQTPDERNESNTIRSNLFCAASAHQTQGGYPFRSTPFRAAGASMRTANVDAEGASQPSMLFQILTDEQLLWKALKTSTFYRDLVLHCMHHKRLPYASWLRMQLQVSSGMSVVEVHNLLEEEDWATATSAVRSWPLLAPCWVLYFQTYACTTCMGQNPNKNKCMHNRAQICCIVVVCQAQQALSILYLVINQNALCHAPGWQQYPARHVEAWARDFFCLSGGPLWIHHA